jgi:hypothetical protein
LRSANATHKKVSENTGGVGSFLSLAPTRQTLLEDMNKMAIVMGQWSDSIVISRAKRFSATLNAHVLSSKTIPITVDLVSSGRPSPFLLLYRLARDHVIYIYTLVTWPARCRRSIFLHKKYLKKLKSKNIRFFCKAISKNLRFDCNVWPKSNIYNNIKLERPKFKWVWLQYQIQ